MRLSSLAIAVLLMLPGAFPATANPPAEVDQPGRFVMQPVDGGIMRLDTKTGAVSLCTRKGTGFSCEPVPESRAPEGDLARLAAENRELKDRLARLESEGPAPRKSLELPTEAEVDKALDYFERMVKKFRDRMKSLEGSSGKGTPL
ncbi:MAG TPA: hypothetical protein VFV47_06435 [Hyphomicrobiaceae bacterium]|nr:hypothetical protein [Hyphomicrobiaceae bacterium]